ncbi:MAG: AAA family ATPase, partial [Ignavibacteriaceae bacterium]|nr:AAA family ATPase [Ignavibacteriaceae bacterium]
MKIQSMEISNYPPIKNLKLDDLGNVVIIAGANGSGKTRLKQAIVQTLQGSVSMSMTLKATRKDEKKEHQNDTIVINQGQQNEILNNYMNSRRFGRGRYVGSLVQIDSHR